MIYDLHAHSNASDGILSPDELVSRAKSKGVSHLALTDHDTTKGLHQAALRAHEVGIEVINGIEFSTQWAGRGVHILGLNIDPAEDGLRQLVDKQGKIRVQRGREIASRLEQTGVEGAWEGTAAIAGDSAIGRPHFAQYLIQQGYVNNASAAFKRYLGTGTAGDVKHGWPEIEQIVAAIKAAGGVAVVAHPGKYKLTRTKLRILLQHFIECGGVAMEVISGHQTPNDTGNLAVLAEQLDLYASCGSDFHLPNQPWQELGAFGTLPARCKPVWSLWH